MLIFAGMSSSSVSNNYTASALVSGLHGLTHIDTSFRVTNSTFDPTNSTYIQSLAMYAFPFVLIATLVVLFDYLRFCCCERKSRVQPAPSSTATVRCRVLFVGALALYGLIPNLGRRLLLSVLPCGFDRVFTLLSWILDCFLLQASANPTCMLLAEFVVYFGVSLNDSCLAVVFVVLRLEAGCMGTLTRTTD